MNQDMAYLEDWIFHYNAYANQWAAFPRETYTQYWNDYEDINVLRSKELPTLLDLLHKTKGDKLLIEKLTSGKTK
jgi:hypothetical protein